MQSCFLLHTNGFISFQNDVISLETYISNISVTLAHGVLVDRQKVELCFIPRLMQCSLIVDHPSSLKCVKRCGVLTVLSPLALPYKLSLVVNEHYCGEAIWNIAAFEFSSIAGVHFIYAAEQGVPGFQCYHEQMGTIGCRYSFPTLLALAA